MRGLVDGVGLWCAAGYGALAWLARQPGEPGLGAFFLLAAWTGLPVFGLYLHFRRRGAAFPVGRLVAWAVVFRICGLVGGPFYEDDFYRYLWDAFRFATVGTPYGAAPEEFFVDPTVPLVFQAVLDGINYPELPTIYGPTTQLVFLLGYAMQPASVTVLQAILVAVDLAAIALLLRLTTPVNVLLYAWCPLVIKEIAFTAHPDGVGVCLLLAAIVLARTRRWGAAAACLGLAAGAKVFGLLLAPLVLARAPLRYWALCGGTLAALYAPFVALGGTDLASLAVFAQEWEFNAALYGLLAAVAPPFGARIVLALAFSAALAYAFVHARNNASTVPRGDWLFGALLAVSPVINAWYLLWLLPFAAVHPSVWAWTASGAVLLSYVTGLHLGDFEMDPFSQPTWVRWLEFGLIAAGLCCDAARRRLSAGARGGAAPCSKG